MTRAEPTREEIERVVGALIGQNEVADLCGVDRDTPTAWARRHADYPEVIAVIGSTDLRLRSEVLAWLERTGRLPSKPVD